MAASYPSIGPSKKWFRVWIGGGKYNLYHVVSRYKAQLNDWRLNWCGFGDVFPSGSRVPLFLPLCVLSMMLSFVLVPYFPIRFVAI